MKILVPVSGGKDSQVCLKLAVEQVGAENVRGLFCDTRFEHPLTYAHIETLRDLYGVRIDAVSAGNVPDKVRKHRRFPSGTARFCTDELKIKPTIVYMRKLAKEWPDGFETWYGMRTGESTQRAIRYANRVSDELYAPHEYMPSKYPKGLQKLGIMVRMPILEWTRGEVLAELEGTENPLYAAGFDRVGCFPCLAAGDKHKERAFGFDETGRSHKVIVLQLQLETGKSVWTSKSGQMRNHPDQMCMLCQQ